MGVARSCVQTLRIRLRVRLPVRRSLPVGSPRAQAATSSTEFHISQTIVHGQFGRPFSVLCFPFSVFALFVCLIFHVDFLAAKQMKRSLHIKHLI